MSGIIRNIAIVVTVILFVLSSVGIALSRHVCYKEGTINFSLTGYSTCKEHQCEQNAFTGGCCKKSSPHAQHKKKCCRDDVLYMVLDTEKKHEDDIRFRIPPFSINSCFLYYNAETAWVSLSGCLYQLLTSPVITNCGQLHIVLCVFRL